jgi:hypothetical protein
MYSVVNGIDRSSASVGFIHKESVTMHGHTIVKFRGLLFAVCRCIILCVSLTGLFAIDILWWLSLGNSESFNNCL